MRLPGGYFDIQDSWWRQSLYMQILWCCQVLQIEPKQFGGRKPIRQKQGKMYFFHGSSCISNQVFVSIVMLASIGLWASVTVTCTLLVPLSPQLHHVIVVLQSMASKSYRKFLAACQQTVKAQGASTVSMLSSCVMSYFEHSSCLCRLCHMRWMPEYWRTVAWPSKIVVMRAKGIVYIRQGD